MGNKHTIENIEETSTALLNIIKELVAELHPGQLHRQAIMLDSSLDRDMGLDSLGRVELLSRIERSFGVMLSDRVFSDAETPRDLLRAILSAIAVRSPTLLPEVVSTDIEEIENEPRSAQTIVDVLKWHVKSHPDRIHIQFYSDEGEDETLSYGKLWEGAKSVASGLQQRGLRSGEPVAIILPTGRDYFFTFFGILLAGGVPVPLYPPMRLAQLEDHLNRQRSILSNCKAPFLITMPEAKRFVQLLKSRLETLKSLLTVKELCSVPEEYREPFIGKQDLALLQYTSGSTGNPKGVSLSHVNLLVSIRTMGQVLRISSKEIMVSWLPLYHDMGLIGAWLGSLYFGFRLIIMSPIDFLTRPQRWFRAIHKYRANLSVAPNFAYELCLHRLSDEELDGLDLSSWRVALNGAEPISSDTVERFCNRFQKYGFRRESFMPVYGLAECTLGLSFPPLGRPPLIDKIQREPFMRAGKALTAGKEEAKALCFVSCGRPLPGHEIRIVDSKGREIPERMAGQLQFRGPSATSGYFRNADETRLLFKGDWLDSGDMAYIAGGDVFITGRNKDMIIKAGRNIYPQELEEAVCGIPGIRKGNVAVLGSMDTRVGTERLVILAETRKTVQDDLDKLHLEINEITTDLLGIPPDDVVLLPPRRLLKTSSGKIRRAALRELYEQNRISKSQKATWLQVVSFGLAGLKTQIRRFLSIIYEGAYAGYVWALFSFVTPIVWVTVVLLPVYSWRWSFIHWTGRFLVSALRIPLIVNGLENLPDADPCILVVNHASYIDSFVMVAALPRNFRFVAKSELANSFGAQFFLSRLGTEFVERFDKQKSIEDARRITKSALEGSPLLFYPEGTLTRIPGLLPFHMGAFQTAAKGGLTIVPIAIRGSRSILRGGTWFPRRGPITITITSPIKPRKKKDGTKEQLWKTSLKLRDESREQILHYCGEPNLAHEQSPLLKLI